VPRCGFGVPDGPLERQVPHRDRGGGVPGRHGGQRLADVGRGQVAEFPGAMVLREYEDFYNSHRPHRALDQAAPLRPLPERVTDLDHFQVQRDDRAGGVIHEYRLVA